MARDLPIPFKAPMVRATLREIERRGTGKTQTRRVIEPQPASEGTKSFGEAWRWKWTGPGSHGFAGVTADQISRHGAASGMARYAVGDRLWVREAHYLTDDGHQEMVVYATDTDAVRQHLELVDALPAYFSADLRSRHKRLRSGMFLPRWASRITLIVTDVRVQRLQEISRDDAIAEGLSLASDNIEQFWRWPEPHHEQLWLSPVAAYRSLWDGLNAARGHGWDANPWIAAYTFRPLLGNIDTLGEAA